MAKEITYSEKLQHPNWQKKRLIILKRDKFKCCLCGDKETQLHIHHTEYKGNPWDVPNDKLKAVCSDCHKILHEYHLPKHLRNLPTKDVVIKVVKLPKEDGWYTPVFVFTDKGIRFMFVLEDNEIHLQCTIPNDAIELLHKAFPKILKSTPKAA